MSSLARASSRLRSRATTTRSVPSAASRRAMTSPMPLEAPVTSARFHVGVMTSDATGGSAVGPGQAADASGGCVGVLRVGGVVGGTIRRRPVPSTRAQPWWVLRRWSGDAEPVQGAELGEVGVGPVDAVVDLEVAGGAAALAGALAADPVQDGLLAGRGPPTEVGDVEHVHAVGDDQVDRGLGQQGPQGLDRTGPSPSISQVSPATRVAPPEGRSHRPGPGSWPAARPAPAGGGPVGPGAGHLAVAAGGREPQGGQAGRRRSAAPRRSRCRPGGPCRTRPAPTAPAGPGPRRWSWPALCRGASPPPRPRRRRREVPVLLGPLGLVLGVGGRGPDLLGLALQLRHRRVLGGVQQLELGGWIGARPRGHLVGLGRRQLPVPQRLIGRRQLVEFLGGGQVLLGVLRGLAGALGQPPGLAALALAPATDSSIRLGQPEPGPRREPIQRRQPLDALGGLGRAESVGIEVGAEPAQPGLDLGQRSERVGPRTDASGATGSPGGVDVGRVEHLPLTLRRGVTVKSANRGVLRQRNSSDFFGGSDRESDPIASSRSSAVRMVA